MSDYEAYTGTIKKVKVLIHESYEDLCERLYTESGGTGEYYKGILFDEFYDDYVRVGEDLYKVIEKTRQDPDDSYCDLVEKEDGTISFSTRYYNGGTCMSEMIEHELKK